MKKAPIPENEKERLETLHSYDLFESNNDPDFDAVTEAVAAICNTPISLVTLIDRDRQWFKSKFGLKEDETPRDVSFCGHVIVQDDLFIVEDAHKDERFYDNPLFTGEPNIRFYAGYPITMENGHRIGTLCAIDHHPRKLSLAQKNALKSLSQTVVSLIKLRKTVGDLKYSKNKLDALFRFSPAAIYECGLDKRGTLSYVNQQLVDLVGTNREDFCPSQPDMSLYDFIHPDDQEEFRHKRDQALSEGRSFDLEHRIVQPKGEERWVLHRGGKQSEGDTIVGALLDTTEKKKSELVEQLRSQVKSNFIEFYQNKEKFYQFILEMLFSNLKLDFAGIAEVREVERKSYLRFLNTESLSWQEDPILVDNFMNPGQELPEGIEQVIQEVKESSDQFLITSDGSLISINLSFNAESVGAIFLSAENLSAEDFKKSFVFTILDDVAELFYTLKIQEDYEKQKNLSHHQSRLASIGRLSAGIGHEINNPLSVVLGQTQILQKEASQMQPQRQKWPERFSKIFFAINRIKKIVKGLKTFSRAESGSYQNIDVSDLVNQTTDMLTDLFLNEEIDLKAQTETNLFVYGDQGKIQQVLVNLLTNAKDAVSTSSSKKIRLVCWSDQGEVKIEVSDTGEGISEEVSDKIFDPFFTTKGIGVGTGLGLPLIADIVKEHKGTLDVRSQENKGTSFYVSLPQLKQGEGSQQKVREQTEKDQIPNAIRQEKSKVMLIDDEEDLREVLVEMLEDEGLEVSEFSSSKRALDYLTHQACDFDLILSDLQMPEMSGLELGRKIHQNVDFRGAFFLITGNVEVSLQEHEQYVDGVLSKPFDIDQVVKILEEFNGRS